MMAVILAMGWLAGSGHFVAPNGSRDGTGTRERPWDIESALDGSQKVAPGDRILLRAGIYRRRPNERFEVKLQGTEDHPITVQPAPGEHAVIDGGLLVQDPSAFLWFRDLEVTVSEPDTTKEHPATAGSFPEEFKRPWGGLEIVGGHDCKFIDLAIHDCRQGVGFWSGAKDDEIYGCVIYDNGWTGVDRGHGHGIYTQNQNGRKIISDCIFTGGRGYSLHAYGSNRAYVDHFLIQRNVAYDCDTFLIGGGRPSVDIRVLDNVVCGTTLRIGYDAPYNVDCVVNANSVVGGSLQIEGFKSVQRSDNLVLAKGDRLPSPPQVRLFRNRYDPDRAHLVAFGDATSIAVSLAGFAKTGDRIRFFEPRALFGSPKLDTVYRGKPMSVPMANGFAAFVVTKSR